MRNCWMTWENWWNSSGASWAKEIRLRRRETDVRGARDIGLFVHLRVALQSAVVGCLWLVAPVSGLRPAACAAAVRGLFIRLANSSLRCGCGRDAVFGRAIFSDAGASRDPRIYRSVAIGAGHVRNRSDSSGTVERDDGLDASFTNACRVVARRDSDLF